MKGNDREGQRQRIENKLIDLCDKNKGKETIKEVQEQSKVHWPSSLFEHLKYKRPDVAWIMGKMAGHW